MAKEKSLLSSLLPVTKLERVTLTDGSDGNLNIDLDISILLDNSSTYLSEAFNPPSFNYNGLGDGPFGKIKDYINYAVVLKRYKSKAAFTRIDDAKSRIRYSLSAGNSEKGFPHVVGFSDADFGSGETEAEFSERLGRQKDEVIFLNNVFTQSAFGVGSKNFGLERTEDPTVSKITHRVAIHGVYPKSIEDLRVAVYSYIDLKDFLSQVPEMASLNVTPRSWWSPGAKYSTVSGFGSFDVIMENGRPGGNGFVLLTPDGVQYTGPYHIHSDGSYMVGERHNSFLQQDVLTKVETNISKVQDFRGLERFQPKPPQTEDLIEKFGSVFQDTKNRMRAIHREFLKKQEKFDGLNDAEINIQVAAVEQTGNRPGIFGEITVNQGEILKQNSKLGYLYPYLNSQQKSYALWWGDMFRVVEVKLLRRRLTDRYTGWDRNGYRARKVFDEDTVEEVIASNYEELKYDLSNPEGQEANDNFYDPSTLVVSRGEFATATTDALFFPETNNSVKGLIVDHFNWINQVADGSRQELRTAFNTYENYTDPERRDQVLFPWRRTFNFADATFSALKQDHRGVFQYGIEITYEDGLVKYITELVARMNRLSSFVDTYVTLTESQPKDKKLDSSVRNKIAKSFGANFQSFINDVVTSYSDGVGIIDALNYTDDGLNKQNHPIFFNRMTSAAADAGYQLNNAALAGAINYEGSYRLYENRPGIALFMSLGTGAWKARGNMMLKKKLGYLFSKSGEDSTYSGRVEVYSEDLKMFGKQYGIVAKTLADLIGFSESIYGGSLSDAKSSGGKSASLIKVKKFFGDKADEQTGLVSGGVVDLRNTKVPSCSILPRGTVSIEQPIPVVSPEVIQQAISLESIKFGGGDVSEYAQRVAYFTPNIFYGSNILDLWKTTGGYSRNTYNAALKALEKSYAMKKKKLFDSYEKSIEEINSRISNWQGYRQKALITAEDNYNRQLQEMMSELNTKRQVLKSRQENGEFSDEDFALIDDFDEFGNNQKLALAHMITKLLRDDRGYFTNLDGKTPDEIAELTRQLFNRGEDFPGIAASAELLGEELPEDVEVPTEEECSALSERQITALTHNQRVDFTESVLQQEFTDLQESFASEISSYVDALSANTAGVDDNATIDTNPTLDTAFIEDLRNTQREQFVAEQKIKEAQRAEEYQRIAAEQKKKEEERKAKQAAIDAGEIIPYPFQIDRVINGETSYGIEDTNKKMNPAVYGNFYVLKRRELDKERSNQCRTNIYYYVEVSIADALDGLEPGHYGFFPYESSALVKSGKYILDVQRFVVEKFIPPVEQQVETKKAEEETTEKFIEDKKAEVKTSESTIESKESRIRDLEKQVYNLNNELKYGGKFVGFKDEKGNNLTDAQARQVVKKQIAELESEISRLKAEVNAEKDKVESKKETIAIAEDNLVTIKEEIVTLGASPSTPTSPTVTDLTAGATITTSTPSVTTPAIRAGTPSAVTTPMTPRVGFPSLY